MNETTCDAVKDLLIDFADRSLDASESAKVAKHMDNCASCQDEVTALRQSLSLAQSVWRDSVAEFEESAIVSETRQPKWLRPTWAMYAATAAVVLVVAIRSLVPLVHFVPSETELAKNAVISEISIDRHDRAEDGMDSHSDVFELSDFEEFIRRKEQSARLAASIQILATVRGLAEVRARATGYLHDTYGVEVSNEPSNGPASNNSILQGS